MSHEALRLDPWLRGALLVWCVMTLAVCIRSAVQPQRQSVYPVWKGAGHDWRTGHDLYDDSPGADGTRFGFRYSPLAAATFTLFDLVPERAGNVAWRLSSAVLFLSALLWWLRDGAPRPSAPTQRGLIVLLTAPVALGSLNNGQVNLLLVALFLTCLTAVAQERWNLAAVCAALAVLLKIYPIALVLLLALVHPRRFALRFLLALLVFCAVPFLLQHPEYVARQYGLWYQRVAHQDVYRRFWPIAAGYRDVWQLIRVWNVPVSLQHYSLLQLGGGLACAVLTALSGWRLGPGRRLLFVLHTLGAAWMLLLGPSPESCTYVLIAPTLAWWLVHSRQETLLPHYLAAQGYGLLLLCVVSGTSSLGIQLYHVPGLQPIAVLLFTAGLVGSLSAWLLWPEPEQQATPTGASEAPVCRAA